MEERPRGTNGVEVGVESTHGSAMVASSSSGDLNAI